ncbi:GNAT family N-acetyltransferase [Flavisolibacter tropicus]|uniref:GNAT family N-acetyltransferase n=1 Tax=Flavisolibacter tropicus TaxID=1492898 RepID=UPI0009ECE289|nr:GNAT family N-acetyltransferase [Flavisolibacter tropicus]
MILIFLFGAIILLALGIYGYVRYKRVSYNNYSKLSFPIEKTTHNFSIQHANLNDINSIRNLALEIWPKTYAETYSPQQVIYMLNKWFSEASLQRQMTIGHQYHIINAGNQSIGFASYSEVAPSVYKLHKIYILPAYQGLGAGKFTMDKIIAELTAKKAAALTLNVNQYNPAKAFYEQLGFTVAKTEFSEVGNGYFINDFVMELKLSQQAPIPQSQSILRSL